MKVSVTPTQTLAWTDRIGRALARARALVIANAYAALNPTVSGTATATIVNGAVSLVNPVFTTTVPDSTAGNPSQTKTVSVVCDTQSIPVTVNVLQSWALNIATGDILVNMEYPSSVTATYDSNSGMFSACSFVYSQGYFVVYANQSTATLDMSTVMSNTGGCAIAPTLSVVANGDPSRNTSSYALLNTLVDSSTDIGGSFIPGPLCGGVWALSYAEGAAPSLSETNFSQTVAPSNAQLVADATNVYAVGTDLSSRQYGESFPSAACPVVIAPFGASSSSCETVPNATALFVYPTGNGSSTTAYYPTLYLADTGIPGISLSWFGTCTVGTGSCQWSGNPPVPQILSISPSGASATAVTVNAPGYPWGYVTGLAPVGSDNGWVLMGDSGGSPFLGVLWNPATGGTASICGPISSSTGCTNTLVFGNIAYGILGCIPNTATPAVCGGTPTIGVFDTVAGTLQTWNPVPAGWLPLSDVQVTPTFGTVAVPLWYTDQVIFLACPSGAGLNCAAPVWVSLDYSTGVFTAQPNLQVNIVSLLVQTTL